MKRRHCLSREPVRGCSGQIVTVRALLTLPAPAPRIASTMLLMAAVTAPMVGPTGCATDKQYSQTELATLQSRDFDASYESTYSATINALFDAGYIIRSSDKDAGFVAASRTQGNSWSGYQFHGVQVKISPAGSRTNVRVSNTDGMGQQKVNKEIIDELLDLVERRLLGDLTSPPSAASTSTPASSAKPVAGQPLRGPGR